MPQKLIQGWYRGGAKVVTDTREGMVGHDTKKRVGGRFSESSLKRIQIGDLTCGGVAANTGDKHNVQSSGMDVFEGR